MPDEQQPSKDNEATQPEPAEVGNPTPAEREEHAAAAEAASRRGPAGEEVRNVSPRERRGMNRRELLKLVPLIAVGAFAIPKLQEPLLTEGLHLSDWASAKLFSRHRLAQTYGNNDVAPFEKFPYNYYDVADPNVDLGKWTLTVEGLVRAPVITRFSKFRRFPRSCRTRATFAWRGGCNRQLRRPAPPTSCVRSALICRRSISKLPALTSITNRLTWRRFYIRRRSFATRCMASHSTAGTARPCGSRCRPSWVTSRQNISTRFALRTC